jgi:hypothetical protein
MARTNLVVALAVVALAGCHRPIQPTEPTTQRVLVADATGEDRLWEAAQEVLRRHRFPLDRVDRRSGTITTLPVTSQSFFEFWRHDVDTAFDLAEASLRTVRRSAVVQLDRHPESGEVTVTVTVRRETFATPERQFNSSASSLRVFGDELPGVRGERRLTREDDYWIDDGRDEAMERRLLERIMERSLAPRVARAGAY